MLVDAASRSDKSRFRTRLEFGGLGMTSSVGGRMRAWQGDRGAGYFEEAAPKRVALHRYEQCIQPISNVEGQRVQNRFQRGQKANKVERANCRIYSAFGHGQARKTRPKRKRPKGYQSTGSSCAALLRVAYVVRSGNEAMGSLRGSTRTRQAACREKKWTPPQSARCVSCRIKPEVFRFHAMWKHKRLSNKQM